MVCNACDLVGEIADCRMCRDPFLLLSRYPTAQPSPFMIREKPQRINRGRSRDHSFDRNSADDGIGATAASDIRLPDGNSGGDHRRSIKVCLVDIRV
jgi:hypothetical protein